MKCEEIKGLIDQNIFEEDAKQRTAIKRHVSDCSSCRNYYEQAIEEATIIRSLRASQPTLSNPDLLTADIMSSISGLSGEEEKDQSKVKSALFIQIALKILAAASVCLFIVFGAEQYFVLDKLQALEAHANISTEKESFFSGRFVILPVHKLQFISTQEIQNNIQSADRNSFIKKAMIARLGPIEINRYGRLKQLLTDEQLLLLSSSNHSN